eukprot:TRINITY_DN16582_c0_g1_i1.p1 TRINITY_DN16582_c0_g1~~TRINITY_DN16582_c0_g1_i1.p1  ORF type:complete len:133 (+),score=20.60 TRINITY_DN16582_c0_g1_i1:78-476(+)
MESQFIVLVMSVIFIKEGNSILCNTPTAGSPCASGTSNCAIKQDSSGTEVKTEKYCNSGTVGCTEIGKIITCECSTNDCNADLASAGYKAGSSTGSGSGSSDLKSAACNKNNSQWLFVVYILAATIAIVSCC